MLAFLLQGVSLGAETTNALTLGDCLRESLSANHALLARSAESDAFGARANVVDGVLLIETAEHQRAAGKRLLEATLGAGLSRLHPRLLIALPVVLGFTPFAFAFEEGGELLRPMAAAAIGGLLFNVFVALLLVPVLCTWMAGREVRATATSALAAEEGERTRH